MKILRKVRLPHLPLEDPLPQVKEVPEKSRWHGKSVEQQILAQDLEHINHAIAELRQHQEFLQRRILPLSNIPKAGASGFKPHLPLVITSPRNINFFDQELAGVNQTLAELETRQLGVGKLIVDIPPLPPKPSLYPVTDLSIQEKLERLPLKQETVAKKSKDKTVKITIASKRTKSLLDRLQFGVIELQNKWAEVKGNLEKLEYPSPQVRDQLSRLDSELTQLEKVSAQSGTSFLDYDSQKLVQEDFKQILERINQQPVIPYELVHIEKHLRELPKYQHPKIKILRITPPPGTSKELPEKKQIKVHQSVQELITNLSREDLKDFELLTVEKNLKELPNHLNSEYKISKGSFLTHGHVRDLNEKRIKSIHRQTDKFLSSLEESIESRNYDFMQVDKNITDLDNLQFKNYNISSHLHPSGQVSELTEKKIKTIHQEVERILNQFEIPKRTKKELDRINLKLSAEYLVPKAEIRDLIPKAGQIQELSRERRKKAKEEIKQSLNQIKKNWRTDQKLEKINDLMKKPLFSRGRLMTRMTLEPGSVSELSLFQRKTAHKEIQTILNHTKRDSTNRNRLKEIQKKIKQGYLPPPAKIMNGLSSIEGKTKEVNLRKMLQKFIYLHQKVKVRIKKSKKYQYRTKEVKKISQMISKGITIKPVKYCYFSPSEGINSPLSEKTREKISREVREMISKANSSSDALDKVERKISENFEPPKVKIGSLSAFEPLVYEEKNSSLEKELQQQRKSIKIEPIKITPEIELINKKLAETRKAKLQKNKVMQKFPRSDSAESRRLKKEFREIQTMLVRSFKDPTILLGRFRKKSPELEETEKRARREVFRIMKKIEGYSPNQLNELLQVEQRLKTLNNLPLEKGKVIKRSSGKVKPSVIENAFLQQELDRIKQNNPNIAVKKTKELLEIESKLARIYAS